MEEKKWVLSEGWSQCRHKPYCTAGPKSLPFATILTLVKQLGISEFPQKERIVLSECHRCFRSCASGSDHGIAVAGDALVRPCVGHRATAGESKPGFCRPGSRKGSLSFLCTFRSWARVAWTSHLVKAVWMLLLLCVALAMSSPAVVLGTGTIQLPYEGPSSQLPTAVLVGPVCVSAVAPCWHIWLLQESSEPSHSLTFFGFRASFWTMEWGMPKHLPNSLAKMSRCWLKHSSLTWQVNCILPPSLCRTKQNNSRSLCTEGVFTWC